MVFIKREVQTFPIGDKNVIFSGLRIQFDYKGEPYIYYLGKIEVYHERGKQALHPFTYFGVEPAMKVNELLEEIAYEEAN